MATRTWVPGTTGDWYLAANWTTAPPPPNDFPQAGDFVFVDTGTPTISAIDSITYGPILNETIRLGSTVAGGSAAIEATDETFGLGTVLTVIGRGQDLPTSQPASVTLTFSGTTVLAGDIVSKVQGGTLTIDVESDGSDANFTIAAAGSNPGPGVISVAQGTLLELTGVQITNDGVIQDGGLVHIAAGLDLLGSGEIDVEADGAVSVDGAVGPQQRIVFLDNGGRITLDDPATFQATIVPFAAGNRIDLPGLAAQSLQYVFGVLNLYAAATPGGTPLASIVVDDPAGTGAADFTLSTDGSGGSRVTYTPQGAVTVQASLPFAAVGVAGTTIPFQTLLQQAFGTVPGGYATYTLSPQRTSLLPTESYWQQAPGQPMNAYWLLDGAPVTTATTVSAADIGRVSFFEGNSIVRTAYFTVPVASAGGAVTQNIQYNIWTVDPSVLAPETGDATPSPTVPGSGSRFGRPDPTDEVASAYRYSTIYPDPLNTNNCNWIADNVAAGAGAVMPYDNASTDPADNVSGGFWRIVYRGSDSPNPVQDWGAIVRPGDIVRLQWLRSLGPHTTSIIGTVNPDGKIAVYDNVAFNSENQEIIGVHDAGYWKSTDPLSITIYRLDPLHQYLIEGTGQSEFLQGSVFDNLIRPGGGGDTITAGAGNNEVQGTAALLDGLTLTDAHLGDVFDVTDLDPARASASFLANTLVVARDGVAVARITLPNLAGGQDFLIAADGAGGTTVTLSPVGLGYTGAARAAVEQALGPLAASGRTTSLVGPAGGAFTAPVAGEFNIALFADPAAGATLEVPHGYVGAPTVAQYQAAIAQGSNPITLFGSADGHTLLVGNAGGDVLVAAGDANTVVGGAGDDKLFGGAGTTMLVGGGGADTLVAGSGATTLIGGTGSLMFGGTGATHILAGTGADTIAVGSGDVTVSGGSAGGMLLFGGAGGLSFRGAAGDDTVIGGAGAATISAGTGDDVVFAGTGADLIEAGSGNAALFGGGGADLFGFTAGQGGGLAAIGDFAPGADHVQLRGYGTDAVADALATAQTASYGTTITLGDGTRIVFFGVTSLNGADFA